MFSLRIVSICLQKSCENEYSDCSVKPILNLGSLSERKKAIKKKKKKKKKKKIIFIFFSSSENGTYRLLMMTQ